MDWYWLMLIGAICFAVAIFGIWKFDLSVPRESLDARMKHFANSAVRLAKTDYQTQLDFTQESIDRVQEILIELSQRHATNAIDEKKLSKIVLTWGAYVGEVLRSRLGGDWKKDSKIAGENTFPIVFATGESIPVIWCLKMIRHGEKEPLVKKFLHAIDTFRLSTSSVQQKV